MVYNLSHIITYFQQQDCILLGFFSGENILESTVVGVDFVEVLGLSSFFSHSYFRSLSLLVTFKFNTQLPN